MRRENRNDKTIARNLWHLVRKNNVVRERWQHQKYYSSLPLIQFNFVWILAFATFSYILAVAVAVLCCLYFCCCFLSFSIRLYLWLWSLLSFNNLSDQPETQRCVFAYLCLRLTKILLSGIGGVSYVCFKILLRTLWHCNTWLIESTFTNTCAAVFKYILTSYDMVTVSLIAHMFCYASSELDSHTHTHTQGIAHTHKKTKKIFDFISFATKRFSFSCRIVRLTLLQIWLSLTLCSCHVFFLLWIIKWIAREKQVPSCGYS